MKEKIKEALKTKYANLGLSDNAFSGVAAVIAKTVKEENEIVTAVSDVDTLNLLKGLQGEIDSYRTKSSKYEKELEELRKKAETKPTETKPKDDEIPDYAKKILERFEKLDEQDKAKNDFEKLSSLKSQAKVELEKKGIKGRLCDKYLKDVSLTDDLTVEKLIEKGESEHNFFLSELSGDGSGKPFVPAGNGDGKSGVDSFLERKKAERERQAEISKNLTN